ncbi:MULTISPECIES: T6SS immunity protein Tdi1 domain-containing protein [Streptococcus]|nr:T6SS immunity protein Tdi1 domain-containing protein [Streptococcus suis]MCK3882801.1 DUF1851 domain-containing protein [Streptococcus suis]NQK93764.1 DUF1851 domain-containing protein [Streptococcus suis]UUM62342.1 DUF1851 domain-containing protein [Streptococcus suis]
MLENFRTVAEMPQEVIEKYKDQIPEELLRIWQEDGLGTFLDGYLKVINPDDYLELIQETYFRGDVSIPIFVTAFGDIITWEKNAYVGIVKYKNSLFDIIIKNFTHFLKFLNNEYITKNFELSLYQEAVRAYGELDYDYCFGFVPLLALGGPKDVKHLDKVKIIEHLYIITQLVGGIGMDD